MDAQDKAWADLDKRAQACGTNQEKLVKLAKSLGECSLCNGGTGIKILLWDAALGGLLGSQWVYLQQTSDGTYVAEC